MVALAVQSHTRPFVRGHLRYKAGGETISSPRAARGYNGTAHRTLESPLYCLKEEIPPKIVPSERQTMPRKTPAKKPSGSGKSQTAQTPGGTFTPGDIAKYKPVIDDNYETFGQLQVGTWQRIPQSEPHERCQSCTEKSASAGSCWFVAFASLRWRSSRRRIVLHCEHGF